MSPDDAILDLALDLFRQAGVDGEIFLERSARTAIIVCDGRVESHVERRSLGAGIRVFEDARVAFAFTADLDREGLSRAIGLARAIAPHTKQDEANVLPEIALRAAPLVNHDPGLAGAPAAWKTELAREVERAARQESPRVQRTRAAAYEDFQAVSSVANTRRGRFSHESSRAFARIELAATDGERSQTGSCVGWALGPAGLDPGPIGREAARRGVLKLGAAQPRTGRTSVVLDPEASALLLGALAGLFSGEAALMGRSLFAGRSGQRVAARCVTLVDDGRLPGACDSAPVDGEGTPTAETILIEDGVLRGFFHSAFTARRMGVRPSGNGVRGGYLSAPEPSPTSLLLRPTGVSRETLLGSVASGIYVTEWMGLHDVNTSTGDFSLGATGRSIENGRLGRALDRMAVSGNILDLLGSVEAVATDLALLVQGPGATVLLRDISVSGA